jgi:parallel beta-helix repeat protein
MPPSGQTIQQMVDAAAPGAVVTVPAGVYRETVWISKPLTLSGAPGAVIDGERRNRWIVAAAHDVTIQGFEMRNSVNEQYWGAITQNANNVAYDRLTVQNNTFIGASYSPIATKLGAGHKILNNVFRDNGALGIRIDSGSGHLIAGNTIYNTNLANAFDSGWEAGGIKVSGNYGGVQNMVIENNEIYNNHGPAIWVDVDGDGFTIRGNRLHHNTRSGITFELSFNARIHDNVVWENGHGYNEWGWGAGILVQSSSGVEVFNNTVAWNADGIAVISQDRGAARWNAVNNNSVYDNTIALVHDGSYNTYALGWLQDWNGQLTSPSSNNRGWGNRYWLPTADGSELRYRWGESYYFKLGDFMSTPGESNARYLSTADNDQLLSTAGVPTSTSRAIASAPIETQEHLALPAAAVAEDPPNEVLQFSETGFALSNAFEAFWNRSGGIPVFGYPLTGELTELNSDTSKAHTVQYLERQRFEYHSDLAGTPYEVLMGRLGVQAAERGGLLETEPFQPLASDPDDNDCLFFAETGHTLCGRFLNYWQRHGLDMGDDGVSYRESLALFGLPISEVFIDPDTGLTSQYFERAIFQHHPDNDGTPYEVLLVRLGAQELSDGAS